MIDPVLTRAPREGDTPRAGDTAQGGILVRDVPQDEGLHEGSLSHERTCIGCGEHADPRDLVRLVLGPDGEVAVDAAGGGFGRGAHVHARGACLVQAATRGLQRASKGRAKTVCVALKEGGEIGTTEVVPLSAAALADAIEAAMARRIGGLLGTAVRTRKARIGADGATSAWRSGDAHLLVVAADAMDSRDLGAVREAVDEGTAVAWGTKQTLATLVFRANHGADGVAVVAITDTRIAAAVRDAVEKTMGARDARQKPQRTPRAQAPRGPRAPGREVAKAASGEARRGAIGEGGSPAPGDDATAARGGVQVDAPRDGNRVKVSKRAGRASGRRARVKQAVAERGE